MDTFGNSRKEKITGKKCSVSFKPRPLSRAERAIDIRWKKEAGWTLEMAPNAVKKTQLVSLSTIFFIWLYRACCYNGRVVGAES
jgi:hypothetical protein